jgi:hypothetical protein
LIAALDQPRGVPGELACVAALAIAALALNIPMLVEGLPATTDLRAHLMWLQHFFKQLGEGIWYPRWIAGTDYGYGSPGFVFYPPLVFYIGSGLMAAGLGAVATTKALFILADLGRGLAFFVAGRAVWRDRVAALCGALVYLSMPYAAVNSYKRGALPETWTYVWIPLGFWLTQRAVRRERPSVALALVFALLFLTNVPGFVAASFAWGIFLLILLAGGSSSWRGIGAALLSALQGAMLAALYLVPGFAEQRYIDIELVHGMAGGVWANFVPRLYGDPQIFVSIIFVATVFSIAPIAFFAWSRWRHGWDDDARQGLAWTLFAIFIAFMMSSLSRPVWRIEIGLPLIQFPWRFQGTLSFALAGLCAWAVMMARRHGGRLRLVLWTIVLGILLGQAMGWSLMTGGWATLERPERGKSNYVAELRLIVDEPFSDGLRGDPIFRPLRPDGSRAEPEPGQPRVSVPNGRASIELLRWQSYERVLEVTATSPSVIRIRTFHYPAWRLFVNGQRRAFEILDDGTIGVRVERGTSHVELHYGWTPALWAGVIISALTATLLLGSLLWRSLRTARR